MSRATRGDWRGEPAAAGVRYDGKAETRQGPPIPRRTEGDRARRRKRKPGARARYNCRGLHVAGPPTVVSSVGLRGALAPALPWEPEREPRRRTAAETWGRAQGARCTWTPAWPTRPQPSTRVPSPHSQFPNSARPPAISPLHPDKRPRDPRPCICMQTAAVQTADPAAAPLCTACVANLLLHVVQVQYVTLDDS